MNWVGFLPQFIRQDPLKQKTDALTSTVRHTWMEPGQKVTGSRVGAFFSLEIVTHPLRTAYLSRAQQTLQSRETWLILCDVPHCKEKGDCSPHHPFDTHPVPTGLEDIDHPKFSGHCRRGQDSALGQVRPGFQDTRSWSREELCPGGSLSAETSGSRLGRAPQGQF